MIPFSCYLTYILDRRSPLVTSIINAEALRLIYLELLKPACQCFARAEEHSRAQILSMSVRREQYVCDVAQVGIKLSSNRLLSGHVEHTRHISLPDISTIRCDLIRH